MLDTDPKKIAERLSLAMRQEGITNTELAEAADVSVQAVGQWLETGTIARDKIHLIVKRIKRSSDYLLGIESFRAGKHVGEPLLAYGAQRLALEPISQWENPEDLPVNDYVLVPRNRVSVSASDGQLLIASDDTPPLIFPSLWIKRQALHRHNLVVFEAVDDRMQPRIYPGDTLLIDRGQADGQDRKSYLLRYGRELRVQRLSRRYDGALLLQSFNPSYLDEIVPTEALTDQVEIIGRVVWAGGEL